MRQKGALAFSKQGALTAMGRRERAMPATIDVLGKKKILIVASNPTVSENIGERAGFWWAEVTHSFWEFVSHGYDAVIASPDGGALEADSWSDPRDTSRLM